MLSYTSSQETALKVEARNAVFSSEKLMVDDDLGVPMGVSAMVGVAGGRADGVVGGGGGGGLYGGIVSTWKHRSHPPPSTGPILLIHSTP